MLSDWDQDMILVAPPVVIRPNKYKPFERLKSITGISGDRTRAYPVTNRIAENHS